MLHRARVRCAACSGRYSVLVIRRRLGEALLIGGEVEIEILEAKLHAS